MTSLPPLPRFVANPALPALPALSVTPQARPGWFKRAIAWLLIVTLNISAVGQAAAQIIRGPTGAPLTGYTANGTYVQNGQVVGNPHQQLHDLVNPTLWTTGAVSFTNSTDPSFVQGTLSEIEAAIAVTPEPGGLALSRLYITVPPAVPLANPYTDPNAGAAGCNAATTCNQAVYNQLLQDAQAGGYTATLDGTHIGKTHASSSPEIFDRSFNLYHTKPVFVAAQNPDGGATAFFALQGEQAKTHLGHLQQQSATLLGSAIFFSQQRIRGPGAGGVTTGSDWQGSIYDPGAAFDAALGSAPSVPTYGGNNGFVVGYIKPDGQAHEFQLQHDQHFRQFQSQQAWNAFDGGGGGVDLNQLLGQELRTAGTQHQAGEQAANSIDFGYFKEDRALFMQGLDLYRWASASERELLARLQSGEIGPGHPQYAQARAVAEDKFRGAYAGHIEYNTQLKHTKESAAYQAQQLDLKGVDNARLFNQGLNLFDKKGDPEQERLLGMLQRGELKEDHPRYQEIRGLAEARFKVAYQKALEPPKKTSFLKQLVSVVIAAIVVYFTAGAASGWAGAALGAGTTATGAVATTVTTVTAAGTVTTVSMAGVAATAIGSAIGAYAGAVVGAGIQTGSLSKALAAGENSLKGGVAGILVNTALAAAGVSATDISSSLGMSEQVSKAVYNTISGSLTQSIAYGGSFGDALVSNAVNAGVDVISADVAGVIGKETAVGSFEKYAAHAALGCGVGMAKSGSGDGCVPAAAGAVAGHMAADGIKVALSDKTNTNPIALMAAAVPGRTLDDNVVFWGGLVGGAAASLAGGGKNVQGDFGLGQGAAANAIKNNYLKFDEIKRLQAELADCKAQPGGCSAQSQQKIEDKYTETSRANARALAECKSTECVKTHQQAIIEASRAGPDPLGQVSSIELAARQDRANAAVQQQYQIVQQIEQGRKEMDAFIASTCKGLSQSACTTKLEQSQETANKIKEIAVGFTPAGVALDIRDFISDPGIGSALMIVAGPVGDAAKLIKGAGSVANKVDDEIAALNRIRDNPAGANLADRGAEQILNLQASKNVGKVTAPIDFDGHILSTEISNRGRIVGGHSTATGAVDVVTRGAPDSLGVYEATVRMPDPKNPGQYLTKNSTMFPDHWTGDRIKVEVDVAYKNRQLYKDSKSGADMWRGITPTGVKVQGFVSPNVTVYPVK